MSRGQLLLFIALFFFIPSAYGAVYITILRPGSDYYRTSLTRNTTLKQQDVRELLRTGAFLGMQSEQIDQLLGSPLRINPTSSGTKGDRVGVYYLGRTYSPLFGPERIHLHVVFDDDVVTYAHIVDI